MAQVYQQAEVTANGAHVRSEARGKRRGADQRRLVHVVIKHFQIDAHSLCFRILADGGRGFQKLSVCFFARLRFPFSGEKCNRPGADELRFVNRFQKCGFCLLAFLFVDCVRVEFRAE
ncbi:hypothetical protein SDC9_127979 [bioreactor metagenome]|uniref:Uncharacterized protein n=1 Tax=bioreactor metagenome TaxID=1076179 RepID=A0A645CVQ4_9ZZZZ